MTQRIPVWARYTGKHYKSILLFGGYPQFVNLFLGNGTRYDVVMYLGVEGYFIGIERVGCFTFRWHGENNPYHEKYVCEKLFNNSNRIDDAEHVTDFMNAQIECKGNFWVATYLKEFCGKPMGVL